MPSATLSAELLAALASGVLWGCLLALAGEGVLRSSGRPTAATRYLVRFAALLAIAVAAAAPVLAVLAPGRRPLGGYAEPLAARVALPAPSGDWPTGLLLLVVAAMAVRAARVVLKLRGVRALKRESRAFAAPVEDAPGGRGALRRSATIDAPVAVGYLNPAILLPDELIRDLSEGELRQVVTHERAHLARFDDWTALVQRLLEAALFFHPAVGWLGGRLDLDREIACDDRVVAALSGERGYARCLARLAEASLGSRSPLATGAVPHESHLASRIRSLLAPRPEWTGVSVAWGVWAMVALAASGAVLPAAIPGFTVVPSFVAAPQLAAVVRVVAPAARAAPAAPPSAAPTVTTPTPRLEPRERGAPARLAAAEPLARVPEPEIAIACGAGCAPIAAPAPDHAIVRAPPVPVRVAKLEGKRREPVISGRAAGNRGLGLTIGGRGAAISVGGVMDGVGLRRIGRMGARPAVGQFRSW